MGKLTLVIKIKNWRSLYFFSFKMSDFTVCQNNMNLHNKNKFFAILVQYKNYFVKIFKIYTNTPIYNIPYYLFLGAKAPLYNLPMKVSE